MRWSAPRGAPATASAIHRSAKGLLRNERLLAAPDDGWRHRPDMDPHFTSLFRASIVARARFILHLVMEQVGRGVGQYVILGETSACAA